jgi:hypothetical protein
MAMILARMVLSSGEAWRYSPQASANLIQIKQPWLGAAKVPGMAAEVFS